MFSELTQSGGSFDPVRFVKSDCGNDSDRVSVLTSQRGIFDRSSRFRVNFSSIWVGIRKNGSFYAETVFFWLLLLRVERICFFEVCVVVAISAAGAGTG